MKLKRPTALVTCLLALAAIVSGSDGARAADPVEIQTELPIQTAGSMIVDGAHERVIVSPGRFGDSIVVLDYAGNIDRVITDEPGAAQMVLDGSTLYVILDRRGKIDVFDTNTWARTDRLRVDYVTRDTLVKMGRRLYFTIGEQWDGFASLDLDTGVFQRQDSYYNPGLATSPLEPGTLLVWDRGSYPSTLQRLDVKGEGFEKLGDYRGFEGYQGVVSPDGSRILGAIVLAVTGANGGRIAAGGGAGEYRVGDAQYSTSYIAPGGGPSYTSYVINFFSMVDAGYLGTYEFAQADRGAQSMAYSPDGSKLFIVSTSDTGPVLFHVLPGVTPASSLSLSALPTANVQGEPERLSGTLTRTDGGPVAGQSVRILRSLTSGSGHQIGTATTDTAGTFTFNDTPAVGRYAYTAKWDGDETLPLGLTSADAFAVVRDVTPPSVEWTHPSGAGIYVGDEELVSGGFGPTPVIVPYPSRDFTLEVVADDNVDGALDVHFLVDEYQRCPQADIQPGESAQCKWTTTNGNHAVKVIVNDKAGNSTESSLIVTVAG